ncbi:ribonuclease III [Polymorphum gilvum]|uniref:Ribonuclease 3 n=1 Tax=Polymorphum gilvum (strain LMG 25793 / CGMCC 1.9160 / SL003B-26A1) TaxID=991905 RepID=F2IW38_POLGS|nr:ribonuclease III [Polymorphum gilvum]ADZ70320.1 Ribonuclease III [Polymorphum gilvum SL003B-26A1]
MARSGRGTADTLEGRLGYSFQDKALLMQALTHASALNAGGAARGSYQRLEFLGDRVLGLAVATMLHRHFPLADEGELARRLNHMVKRETCADIALELDLGEAMRISQSEAQTGGRRKTALLADICEAVIAAIYLDGGFPAAEDFVRRLWEPRMLAWSGPLRDAKTTLQEWAQSKGLPAPGYQVTTREGPDHAPVFVVAVTVSGYAPGEGRGGSKRIAEQNAAEAVLRREGVWTE